MLLRAMVVEPLYLVRPAKLAIQMLRSHFLARTPRQIDEAYQAGDMDYGKFMPMAAVFFIITTVYCTTNPIVLVPCALLYFGTSFLLWKYQLLCVLPQGSGLGFVHRVALCAVRRYVYDVSYQSGGRMWPVIALRLVAGLLIGQLTTIGVVSLKVRAAQRGELLLLLPAGCDLWSACGGCRTA